MGRVREWLERTGVCVGGLGALTWPCGQGAEGLETPCQLLLSWPNLLADSYVEGIVSLHYKTDKAVKEDLELQTWCREITEIGLLGAQDQGELAPALRPPVWKIPPGNIPGILPASMKLSRSMSNRY